MQQKNVDILEHPMFSFRDLFLGISRKYIKYKFAQSIFMFFVRFWIKIFRIESHENSVRVKLGNGVDPFLIEKLRFTEMFFPEINCSFVVKEIESNSFIESATCAIIALLQFKEKVENQSIENEFEAGKVLDMEKYKYCFSSVVKPKVGRIFSHEVMRYKYTDYVVIFIENKIFQLFVPVENSVNFYESIHESIKLMLESIKLEPTTSFVPFGAITCFSNIRQNKLFEIVELENLKHFNIIDRALFSLTLNINDKCDTSSMLLRSIHSGEYRNRDHRRGLQVIINQLGRIGIIVNPHVGIGATIACKLVTEIYQVSMKLKNHKFSQLENKKRLIFSDISIQCPKGFDLDETLKKINCEFRSRTLEENKSYILNVKSCGSDFFRLHGIKSMDSIFNCALHIAYKKTFKRIPIIGSFINLRCVKFGDLWRFNTYTNEMGEFIKNPNICNMRNAIDAHRKLIKVQKRASEEEYLLTILMIKLFNEEKINKFGLLMLFLIGSVFVKNFYRIFISPDIWISNIPARPGLEAAGRDGVKLKFIDNHAFAGHVLILGTSFKICLAQSLASSEVKWKQFQLNLEDSLKQIRGIVEEATYISNSLTRESVVEYLTSLEA